jgi:hypothetical protein
MSAFASTFLIMTFLIFISTSSAIFGYFKCDKFLDLDQSFLELDYALDCDGDRYKKNMRFVIIMLIVYPIGIPLMYAVVLFRKRHILRLQRDDRDDAQQAQVKHLDFVAGHYREEVWYFEVIECFRRLLLTSALVFITPGSATQQVFALLMAMASAILFTYLAPFPQSEDNTLAQVSQWSLIMTFLGALLIKLDLSSNSTEYDEGIFDVMLVVVFCIGPASSIADPTYRCIKKIITGTKKTKAASDSNPLHGSSRSRTREPTPTTGKVVTKGPSAA